MAETKDMIAYAMHIEKLIEAIRDRYQELEDLGTNKAQTAVDYDRAVAIATIRLKQKHPVTMLDKVVKGECAEELFKKMVAESAYKACITKIEANKAQLNAYQSLFRHLDISQK